MNGKMIIAIDGPAGAGKSTVAKKVADRLDFLYIDTGAMYRAVTWLVRHLKLSLEDTIDWVSLLQQYPISLENDGSGSGDRVKVGDRDVTVEIRSPEITGMVSHVAGIAEVRHELVKIQRNIAQNRDVVMDGRDIATHVLPQAEVKIFLTASIDERANRRYEDLLQKGYQPDLENLKKEIAERDRRDQEREVAPLKKHPDAEYIDTTGMSIDEVVDRIITIYHDKVGTS